MRIGKVSTETPVWSPTWLPWARSNKPDSVAVLYDFMYLFIWHYISWKEMGPASGKGNWVWERISVEWKWKWKLLSRVWLYSPWNSPGQNTGVGSLSLLQEIFPTQVSRIAGRFFASWATKQGGEEDLISVLRSLRLFDFFTLHKFCLLKKFKKRKRARDGRREQSIWRAFVLEKPAQSRFRVRRTHRLQRVPAGQHVGPTGSVPGLSPCPALRPSLPPQPEVRPCCLEVVPTPWWKHHGVPMWNFQQLFQHSVGVWRMNSKAEARSAEGTEVRRYSKNCQRASWSLSERKRWEAGQSSGYRSGPVLSGVKSWLFHLETERPSRISFPPCTVSKATMQE